MRRSRILIPASILLVVACGGGGSGSIDPPSKPASYTLTTSNTAAVSFDQSTVTVNEGAPATVTGTLNAGWENLRVAVSNGMTGALTQIGSKFTFVVSNVRSAGVVTAEATAVVPTYTLTTKSLVAGLHFNQSSADIKRGSNVTFTGYVDDGWANVRVAATNSLGGTLTVNGANFTYTIANAQSGGEVQGTADFIIPPAPKGKVVTVASQKVLTDMRPLLEQHLGAIAAEFDVETQIMACPSTPAELRKWLTDNRTGLKHVFLVGQVPVVRRTIKMLDILPSTETQTTDHYYTGIDFTYQEPVLQSDGSHMVPGVLGQYSYQQISLNYVPAFSLSRIMGLSPETELADIRAYLEKNIRLRGNLNAYLRGTISVDAYRTSLSLDTNAINDAHLNHPLSGNGLWTLVRGKTAAESKQAWIDATRSVEYTKLFAHASAVSLGFQGPTVGDDAGIGINDLPTVFSSAIRSRMFMLYDCSTSDYRVDGNLGMRAVLAGDALVSLGAPYVADVHLYRDILDARGFELGLGVGRNLAFMAPYLRLEHWMHFNGDPTIVMRKVDLAQPRPQLVVNGTPIVRESVVPVTLDQPFSGEVGVCKSVTFSNVGNADLVLYISYVPSFSTTALADAGSGGRWSTWKDGNAFIQSVGGYNVPKQLVVLPGQSQAITYVLRAVNDGSVKLTGAQRGYFTVTCNDPRVGVIRIDAQGKIPE